MVLEFAPLAYVLSKGKTIDLASHFLGYVYKAGFDNHAKPLNQNLGGPLWFLQIWLLAYFPDQKVADRSPLNVYGDMFTILASTPLTLTGYLQYFHQLREDKEEKEFVPFQYWGIGPKWISRLMEQRGRSAYHEAWASILLPREIIIGAYVGGCKQAHAEIYCPAQFARQFGLVQAIPCPYPGEINIDLTSRNKIDKDQVAILNAEFKSSRTNFQPYLFTITVEPPLPAFSKWWHNSIELYHESAPVKTFTKDIGTGIEEVTHSDSMLDDGFGRDQGTTSQTSHQEETSKVQSFASVPVAENVKPLRSVPQIMTRSQQQRTTISSPPSESSHKKRLRKEGATAHTFVFPVSKPETKNKKKTLATKEKSSQEDTTFSKVYEASKRRRKILLEEPEEEEAEDVNTSQFVKERRTKFKHAEAFKSPAPASEPESVESQPKLDSSNKTTEVHTPTPLSKDPSQEPTSEPEAVSEQHTASSLVTKAKHIIPTEPLFVGIDKSSEADMPVQSEVDVSASKDDRSLFPEITPSLSTVKITDQLEIVFGEAGPDPVPSIITSRVEEIGASTSTSVGDLSSLEQFKLKVSDFCQRITNPQAPTSSSESPINQLKVQCSSSLSELVKPTFTPEEIQELKEILQQLTELNFENLAEGDLKGHLDICCQAAWALKPASQELHKQLLDRASEFQVKAHQLCEVQEKHLLRESLKAALASADDEARSVISSHDQDIIRLRHLKEEEARLEAALLQVRGEINKTTSNIQTSMSRASQSIVIIKDLKSQLQQTSDQKEIYDFVCSRGAHVWSDLKDTIVQFLSNE
ncbi:hypothetical protein Vadar_007131 [Vaccinium darrowii]|uniref:Uncharacterized protein n=1 Tax=Vaccinium darrowii TaxID=229202 RepID=A0ACB7WZ37_9ERIC|nr:hypothetical protein Vadar_007131 [Vaccinium darrowii]